jgi:Raf kinase inhibitor-like YbhB/YbcL family protein
MPRRKTASETSHEQAAGIRVTSTAFADGQEIPTQYTSDAEGVSPAIKWTPGPSGTQSYALICEDPDAPTPQPWVHWLVYDIPADQTSLNESLPKIKTLPSGASQGKNSSGAPGYYGPRPPSGTHRYYFSVFALDRKLDLAPGATKADLVEAMEGHVLAHGVLMGVYTRR